jgi:hypothetical protein
MAHLEQGFRLRREMARLERVGGASETRFSLRGKRVAERLAVM